VTWTSRDSRKEPWVKQTGHEDVRECEDDDLVKKRAGFPEPGF
jgi:hypothetical protein